LKSANIKIVSSIFSFINPDFTLYCTTHLVKSEAPLKHVPADFGGYYCSYGLCVIVSAFLVPH
ncbi:hypothetical protein, partial [Agathobacter rectalis]|uniref:hypothetical protein n=1 Tax=Agathobacter rectalis TaxID=39491 RepID=UPI0027D2D3EF